MAKPLIIWVTVGGVFVAVALLGIASAWQTRSGDDAAAGHSAQAEPHDTARRQAELRFLKAAFDRLEAEAKQNPNSPALRSLRIEQDAVVLRMREVARPLPRDRLAEEFRALLATGSAETAVSPVGTAVKDAPSPVPPPAIAITASHAGSGAAGPGELKPGLVSAAPGLPLVLSRDPALSGVVLIARPRAPRPAPETPADKPGERHSANANASAAADTNPPAKPPITARAPERAAPAQVSGSVERPASGPVAILGR